jgi:membrane-bound serine protease (ClpP class)
LIAPWLACALVLCAAGVGESRQAPAATNHVVVAEYDGIIHPIADEFFGDVLLDAETAGATAAVFVLRTPGGLLDSTRSIITRMMSARVPVVVFVGPTGARAASAGFLISLAADVAVMAPGTHIGAAHPVAAGGGGGGQAPDQAQLDKATQDTAAYARTLAELRGRNATLAAAAVIESRAFTEREALGASPPLIDFVEPDVAAVLRRLDGRTVTRTDGRTFTIQSAGASVERVAMTWRQRALSALAHPQIAYLLLTLGMLGLVVELWNPGAVLPGVVGGVSLLLAFFAFQVLPISTAGLLLIGLGVALLALELTVPSFGALGIGGAIALLLGSVMITRAVPGVHVSYGILVPVVLALTAIFLFLGRLALRAQRARPVSGAEGLIGERGVSLGPLTAGQPGQIRVHGEVWRAISDRDVAAGQEIRVRALDGLTLHVDPAGLAQTPGGDT